MINCSVQPSAGPTLMDSEWPAGSRERRWSAFQITKLPVKADIGAK